MPEGISIGNIEFIDGAARTMYDWIKKAAELDDDTINKYFGEGYNLYDILREYDHKEFIKIMEKIMEDNKNDNGK